MFSATHLLKKANKQKSLDSFFFFWSFKFTDRKSAKLTSYISRIQLIRIDDRNEEVILN